MLEAVSHHELQRHAGKRHLLIVSVLALGINELLRRVNLDLEHIASCASEDILKIAV